MTSLQDKQLTGRVALFFVVFMLSAGMLTAQSSANYTVGKYVLDSGGAMSQSASYTVHDAIGQGFPVGDNASANYVEASGFFAGVMVTTGVTGDGDPAAVPAEFRLDQNYPNPFNPVTTIDYHLPGASDVVLTVYDVLGNRVRRFDYGTVEAGTHSAIWNGRDEQGVRAASGVYLYRLEAVSKEKRHSAAGKMILMK